jgi:hypothetical protein
LTPAVAYLTEGIFRAGTMTEDIEIQPVAVELEAPETIAVPPEPTDGPKRKASSGYRRLQSRHRHLIEIHEALQISYDDLLSDYHKAKDENAKLKAAVEELLSPNRDLTSDLRKQRLALPLAFTGLMGQP